MVFKNACVLHLLCNFVRYLSVKNEFVNVVNTVAKCVIGVFEP